MRLSQATKFGISAAQFFRGVAPAVFIFVSFLDADLAITGFVCCVVALLFSLMGSSIAAVFAAARLARLFSIDPPSPGRPSARFTPRIGGR